MEEIHQTCFWKAGDRSMFLSLESEALQSAIEFHDSLCDYEIKSKVGVEIIISWLNNLYKNDDALSKF